MITKKTGTFPSDNLLIIVSSSDELYPLNAKKFMSKVRFAYIDKYFKDDLVKLGRGVYRVEIRKTRFGLREIYRFYTVIKFD